MMAASFGIPGYFLLSLLQFIYPFIGMKAACKMHTLYYYI